MNADTQSDVSDEVIEAAAAAGASPLFCAVASADADELGVGRNAAAETLSRAYHGSDGDPREAIKRRMDRAGGFMTALWDGDLPEALYRSDGDNRPILFALFDRAYLLAVLAEDRGSRESARKWLDPYLERYAPDDE